MEAQLCKCNKCNIILIDQNSQIDQPVFDFAHATEMQFINDRYGGFWACPVCGKDDSLTDIVELSQLDPASINRD